ncbi:MAG: hypothetical protein R3C15_19355 [Thermoleophilia bacterium]
MAALDDPLALALWQARASARPVPEGTVAAGALGQADAERVAAALADATRAAGGRQVGWKLGATSEAVQARFGTDRPFPAPLFDTTALADGGELSLRHLVAPRLEPELGFLVEDGVATPCACIELVDARLRPSWTVTLAEAVADFGMHAHAVFGEPVAARGRVPAAVRRDGETLWTGEGDLEAAEASLRWLPDGWLEACGGRALVATGTLCDPLVLEPGAWEVDLGPLGALRVTVVP